MAEVTWVNHLRERLERGQKDLELSRPLTPNQKEVLKQLKELHIEALGLEKEYWEEWLALKKKYVEKFKPIHQSRKDILLVDKDSRPTTDAGPSPQGVTALPDFWLTALRQHSTVAQTIEEYDVPILRFLENIDYEWTNLDEQTSFKIIMLFAENPYFGNSVLSKEFVLEVDPETQGSVLCRSIGTDIQWKAGKNVTKRTVNRKQRNRRTGEVRTVRESVNNRSFFHFFDSHEIPDDEKLETMRESDVADLENTLEVEYEMGTIIRDKIITHALGWYLGIEIDEDEEDEDEDAGSSSEENSEGDDGSDEEIEDVDSDEDNSVSEAAAAPPARQTDNS